MGESNICINDVIRENEMKDALSGHLVIEHLLHWLIFVFTLSLFAQSFVNHVKLRYCFFFFRVGVNKVFNYQKM